MIKKMGDQPAYSLDYLSLTGKFEIVSNFDIRYSIFEFNYYNRTALVKNKEAKNLELTITDISGKL